MRAHNRRHTHTSEQVASLASAGWLEALVSEHQPFLQSFIARRLKPHQEPDDILQDVWSKVLRMEPEQRALVRSWKDFLARSAANLIVDQRRRDQVRQRDSHSSWAELAPVIDDRAFDPERIARGRDALDRMQGRLEQIDPSAAAALVAVRVSGHSYREVAKDLGVSPKRVGRLVEMALRHLA